MLRCVTTINKRGLQRFMHNHGPKVEEKLLAISSQLNKMDEKIVDIEKEVKQHTEHNKKVEMVGEFAAITAGSFITGYCITHIVFKFLLL